MVRYFLSIFLFLMLLQTVSAYMLQVVLPRPGSVLEEGKSYSIRWKTDLKAKLCITGLLGGHERGRLDDCNIDARSGHFLWHIPKGYVSNFGIDRAENAWLAFAPADAPDRFVRSPEFTIVRKGTGHPKPPVHGSSSFPETSSAKAFIRRYYRLIDQKRYRQAYEMWAHCRFSIRRGHAIEVYGLRDNFLRWKQMTASTIRHVRVLSVREISPRKRGCDPQAMLGIREFSVTLSLEVVPGHWVGPTERVTFFVEVAKGTDGRYRILNIGTG